MGFNSGFKGLNPPVCPLSSVSVRTVITVLVGLVQLSSSVRDENSTIGYQLAVNRKTSV